MSPRRGAHGSALLALLLGAGCATHAAPAPPPALPLPPRTATTTGTELTRELTGLSLTAREARVLGEFERGNVPAWLAHLAPVTLRAQLGGREHVATLWVTPDCFGLGSDDDWLRLPLAPQLAQRLADRLDCVLPTPRIVDAIWQQAAVRVAPHPFHPKDHDILSVPVFAASHAAIEAARGDAPRTALLAGHKKDVVVSALLRNWPDRVVIYGWHRLDGRPIQPVWKGHTTVHVDYSHGIRFVARHMLLDGVPTTVDAVLADARLCALLSDEGTIAPARYPLPDAVNPSVAR